MDHEMETAEGLREALAAKERAVIEAARAWADSVQAARAEGFFAPLADALDELAEAERAAATAEQ